MKQSTKKGLFLLVSALTLGFLTDLLLIQNILGLNFTLFIMLWSGVCLMFAWKKDLLEPRLWLYAGLAVTNGGIVFWRISPVVQFWSFTLALFFMALLAAGTYLKDFHSLPLLQRSLEAAKQLPRTLVSTPRKFESIIQNSTHLRLKPSSGVIIAVALSVIFLALFASADAVFSKTFGWLGDFGEWLGNIFVTFDLARFVRIGFWSFVSLVVLFVLGERVLVKQSESYALKSTLATKDSRIILWALIGVFALFAGFQLVYLFAGTGLPDGLTYAEYARRGYGQLLAATLLASIVIKTILSSTFTTNNILQTERTLATMLLLLNNFVLLSAWKRLSLYNAAYGWTWARFIALLGIICIVLGSVALLAWIWQRFSSRRLYAVCWYVVATVLMIAAIANPEALIMKRNIAERSQRETALDTEYLNQLSPDSWPALCANAPLLRQAYPAEYAELHMQSVLPEYTKNSGLARHYTFTEKYKQKYLNCF